VIIFVLELKTLENKAKKSFRKFEIKNLTKTQKSCVNFHNFQCISKKILKIPVNI